MALTDLGNALSTVTLSNYDDTWYMDSWASSHLTHNSSTLSPLFNLSTNEYILVGKGGRIPIMGSGHTKNPPPHTPFNLSNVLYTPKIIKNLISVCKFTTDNQVSIDYDPCDFLGRTFERGQFLLDVIAFGISILFPPSTSPPTLLHLLVPSLFPPGTTVLVIRDF